MTASIAVIGAGPAGTCLVEQICANASGLLGLPPLDLHVVDPHPPDEIRGRERTDLLRAAPRGVRVHVHVTRAVDLVDVPGGQAVRLEDGRTLDVDAVILAGEHHDPTSARQEHGPAPVGQGDGRTSVGQEDEPDARIACTGPDRPPTPHAANLDPDGIPAGEPVIIRGLGAAFTDLTTLLTSGRGGRFSREYDGELVYLPSGREPLLHTGSHRGVPYRARTGRLLAGARPPAPRFPTVRTAGDGPWNFRRDLWPLVAKELTFAYYHELITAHPERSCLAWPGFEEAFAAEEWRSPEMRKLIRTAVPRHRDRLDLERLDRPLEGMRFGDAAGLQKWMRGYLAADLERRADPGHSADHAVVLALFPVHGVLAARGIHDPWFQSFFDHVTGGPPGSRLEELRALVSAGVLTFLGAGLRVEHHEGRWLAQSPTVPGTVRAETLIEARSSVSGVSGARSSASGVSGAADPLIASLRGRGEVTEESGLLGVRPADHRVLDQSGIPHPRRFAFGPRTSGGPADDGFTRPGTDAPLLRHTDALARIVLSEAVGTHLHHVA
ncbi:hypothetical protein FHS43_003382 [Streptosporangium becharense]|uniref:FAD-dependent urate hydroxylase HpyO/Asp monooxygenase CreE-like FAD/NAD(P)-binding domain-containing protein n=1 Tax=Streptosporangium becharense TaxID=1816182 RepID=A0A7W9IEG4_9ACTN|nr:FAD/NAD(P)-binding protein [Streptosporangium becharense]MBB2912102.1 hypothetical protein [Streptosporangium becharense]MBB5818649.1 hypothetical protein [Streptosporangium becharense]